MSRPKESTRATGSSGAKLVTDLNDFLGKAKTTTTNKTTIPSSKASKLDSEAERKRKIIEVLGVVTPNNAGKNTANGKPMDHGWKLPSTTAHAPSSKDAPLPKSGDSSTYTAPQPPSSKPAPPATSAPRPQAGSASQSATFPCPYDDCKRGFRSLKDLRQHKLDEHDYCKVCDEDFDDFDALHKHKIISERHITCTVCSVDFKSEMGRDRHHIQMHGSAHNIQCRGCDVTFAKGAALLLHFERNLCRPAEKPGVTADRFENQRAGIAMVMQARNRKQDEQGESGSLDQLPRIPLGGSCAPSSVGGGVPIEDAEQPDFLLGNYDERDMDFPPLSYASQSRPSSPVESHASTNLLLSEHNYPALNSSNLAKLDEKNLFDQTTPKASLAGWPALGKDKDGIIEGMSNMSMSSKLFPGARPTPLPEGFVPPSVQPSKSGYSNLDFTNSIQLQPNAATGLWECPFYKCSYKCDLRQDLEIHFADRNNGHRGFDHVCPSCLKRYKTPSALMAHLESATTRCSIRNSKGYGNVLHLVSGGHLNIDGRHNDGTTRIVSPEDAGKIPDIIW
ncbi:MAG: hypothetical protein Q9207_003564 [Kuettlingeria erythrocarpa]